MANLESTWSLHCNSTPKCLAVYVTPPIPMASLRSGGNVSGNGSGTGAGIASGSGSAMSSSKAGTSTSTNPFDTIASGGTSTRSRTLGGGSGAGGGNPFDIASSSSSSPPSKQMAAMSMSTSMSASPTTATSSSSSSSKNSYKTTHSVVYGTDRGTLHYRTYPYKSKSSFPSSSSSSSNNNNNNRSPMTIAPIGMDMDSNRNVHMNMNNANGTTMHMHIHPIHQPIDVTPCPNHSSIVACVRALSPLEHTYADSNNNSTNNNSNNNNKSSRRHGQNQNPMFVILQNDKDSFNMGSSRSSLVTTKSNNETGNSTPTSSTNTFAANLITLNQHQHQHQHQHQQSSSANTDKMPSSILATLPRMSSVAYHPSTGYVYSSGSSIFSLPSNVVHLISSTFTGRSGSNIGTMNSSNSNTNTNTNTTSSNNTNNPTNPFGSGTSLSSTPSTSSLPPSSSSSSSTTMTSLLPKSYYHGADILPSCGVRTGNGGLSIICNGHVAVAAMKNGSFYAVNGISVSESFWFHQLEKEHGNGSSNSSGNGNGGHHNAHNNGHDHDHDDGNIHMKNRSDVEKILTFRQSSPVHPAISIEIPISISTSTSNQDGSNKNSNGNSNYGNNAENDHGEEVCTSLVFLASGRECAVVEIMYNPRLYSNNRHTRSNHSFEEDFDEDMQNSLLPSASISCGSIVVGPPRHGIATLASPILAAVGLVSASSPPSLSTTPLVAILTSDGLVHTRSPSFISIPLSTIEVGNRPNDFFTLQALPNKKVVAGSYSGEARLIAFREDTEQDLADRMMKLAIDAFGSTGFPRAELAEAIGATFSATSYVGPEPTAGARNILKQYLETCLGFDMSGDFGGAALYKRFLYGHHGDNDNDHSNGDDSEVNASLSSFAASYLTATAMLCLLCTQLSTPNSSLANRASKACATKFGVVGNIQQTGINASAVKVCEIIAEKLLLESESSRSVSSSSGLATGKNGIRMDMVEAASWLLRSCGQHEKSIEIIHSRMNNPTLRNKAFVEGGSEAATDMPNYRRSSGWSQLKYDSHLCLHLTDLWSCGESGCQELVLNSAATRHLLESNSTLGLRIFTATLPQNEDQWLRLRRDPLLDTQSTKVVELLKSIRPILPVSKTTKNIDISSVSIEVNSDFELPFESGRELAVAYLEAAIGLSTGRPPIKHSNTSECSPVEIHNELAFLLLEGVLSERSDDESKIDSDLGKIYREKLRRLLGWHSSKVKPDQLMHALPTSFLREKALLLGQLGRHEDALRIFYFDLKSLDLALEYCDARYEKQQAHSKYELQNSGVKSKVNQGCAYLPLVRVALESDQDSKRGTAAAIQVLSLRRENIDQAAALRLLPKNIPVSALSRSFLIPALIDSESQARRLTVTASLLRAKYVRLKQSLTEAQIKSQSILQNVPALQSLNLGDSVYASKSFKARPSNVSSLHFPEVSITKHFFPRYVIIQATATAANGMTLSDVQLVVAESSDEALLPSVNVPIKTLPSGITGSSWCVLAASPQRLDGTAILVCEMHYSVLTMESTVHASSAFDNSFQSGTSGRSYVEEIQDIEIRRAEFEG